MTDQQHLITPPPDMLQQWATEYWGNPGECIGNGERYIATKAAQWGADQELEACCEWTQSYAECGDSLRAARRPEPPSLKEQAYNALDTYIYGEPDPKDKERTYNTIRLALEALPND